MIDNAATAVSSNDLWGERDENDRFAAVAAVLVLALASSSAGAEQKGQKGKGPAGPQVRYFDLSSSVFSELNAEAILKETRQGTTLVSAELEVCHLTAPGSNRFDRFVVPLKVEGNRLVGSGQSQEGKQAVSVNLDAPRRRRQFHLRRHRHQRIESPKR